MSFQIKHVSWHQAAKQLRALRTKVFICEYHIPPAIEFDQIDAQAHHVMLLDANQTPIATARIAQNGRVSRIAIASHHRNTGIGKQLLDAIKNVAIEMSLTRLSFNCALSDLKQFKQPCYQRIGGVFMEAGIPRQTLTCDIDKLSLHGDQLIH